MTLTHLRAGRLLALALLCLVSASAALAVPRLPFTLVGDTSETLTPAVLAAVQKTETQGRWSPAGKALTFEQAVVRLVAVTGPENDMLSYRIGGLRNPNLVLSRWALVQMLFVNTDDDMRHNLRFGAASAAYPSVMTAYVKSSIGTSELPRKSGAALHAEYLAFRTPAKPGVYAYFCTVRGHAQSGMAGKVVVR